MTGGGTAGGVVTSSTGAGAVAGALAAKVGIAISVHGGNTAVNAYKNLVGDNKGRVYSNSTKSNGNNLPQGQSGNTNGNSPIDGAKGVSSMASKTLPELQVIAKQNSAAFRQLFGTGKEGAQSTLNNIKDVNVPEGLTKEAMQGYRELINRVPDPTGTQAIRAKILDQLLK